MTIQRDYRTENECVNESRNFVEGDNLKILRKNWKNGAR